MNKFTKIIKSIFLMPMWILLGGGGGDGPDPNQTTLSQQALWSQYAKDWNQYLSEIEPRVEHSYKQALEDPTSRITSELKSNVMGSYNPEQAVSSGVPLKTNLMRSQANLGGMLAGADVKGSEAAKDYQASTLGNILGSKMGAKTGAQSALGTIATGEAATYMKNLENQQAINTAMGKASSSAMGALGTGLYGGMVKQGTTGTTSGVDTKAKGAV